MSGTGELVFLVCGLIATLSAVLTVSQKSPLRSAVALLANVVSVAGLYLTLHAHLLAAIQLLVYAGAVVVLFVFVIMLIGPTPKPTKPRGLMVRIGAGALMAMLGASLAFGVASPLGREYVDIDQCRGAAAECGQFGGVDALSTALFQQSAVPFELVSVLLLVAIVAAVAVARGHSPEEKQALEERRKRREAAAASAGE